jgi:hypothetical protein
MPDHIRASHGLCQAGQRKDVAFNHGEPRMLQERFDMSPLPRREVVVGGHRVALPQKMFD